MRPWTVTTGDDTFSFTYWRSAVACAFELARIGIKCRVFKRTLP